MTIQDTAQKFTKNFAGLELSPLYMLVKERKKKNSLSPCQQKVCFPGLSLRPVILIRGTAT